MEHIVNCDRSLLNCDKNSKKSSVQVAVDSYTDAKERFSQDSTAKRYPSEYRQNNKKDQREKSAILKTLSYLSPGADVLDFPCGAGRLTRLLLDNGFSVRGADVSPGMVEQATRNYGRFRNTLSTESQRQDVQFDLEDIMSTDYKDNEFDAVICNRLFHHFTESETRVKALRELHRIASDKVIISYFNSFTLDAKWRRIRNWMKNHQPTDRIPISSEQFNSELELTGFKIIGTVDMWKYVSQMCYVIAAPIK